MAASNRIGIALIGFGEVGQLFAKELLATGRHDVATYDILFDRGPDLTAQACTIGAEPCATPAAAAKNAQVVISAVTAASAPDAARAAGAYLKPGQFFLDLNSVSPDTKRQDEALVARSDAAYVEAAVMAPVAPYGLKVPMLLGGKEARALADLLNPSGFRMTAVAETVGQASAIKMCRSVFIKGIEALAVEGFLAARRYGVEDQVIASLNETFPSLDWEKQAAYLISRVLVHGRRRAAEMREAADTVRETGVEPLMTDATSRRQDWLADRVAENPALKTAPEKDWRASLDQVLKRLKQPKTAAE